MRKYIYKENDDGSWHKMFEEMPGYTSDVELLDEDHSIDGKIVNDMAGYYLYFGAKGWGSLSDYTYWRFKK